MKHLVLLILVTAGCVFSYAQPAVANSKHVNVDSTNKIKVMKIEIWSDIMCPFCYIGKRKFEEALRQFPERDKIQVEWKSFQLMPDLQSGTGRSIEDILVASKGLSREQVRSMNRQVTQTAGQAGLEFNLDQSVPANTF